MIFTLGKRTSRIAIIFFYAVTAVVILSPLLFNPNIPDISDLLNHLAGIIQAKMALNEGQFPLRIAPLGYDGWRYPFYQFYSPTSYLIAGLLYKWLFLSNPYLIYKLMLWLALVFGAFYIYRIGYWITHSLSAAVLGGLVYITTPYLIVAIAKLAAFNEVLALGILPFVIFYTLQRFFQPSDKTLLITAIGWFLIATIHLVTFIYASFFVAIFLLILLAIGIQKNDTKDLKLWKNLFRVGLGYLFGVILACWYLAPSILYSDYLKVGLTFRLAREINWLSPSFFTLVSPFTNMSYRAVGIVNGVNQAFINSPNIGIPALFGFVTCFIFFIRKKNKSLNIWLLPLLFLFCTIVFLVLNPFNLLSYLPKPFLIFQYSWRLLGQLMWVSALLFSCAICLISKVKAEIIKIILGTTIILLISVPIGFNIVNKSFEQTDDFLKFPFFDRVDYTVDVFKKANLVNKIDNIIMYNFIKNTPKGNILNFETKFLPTAFLLNSKLPLYFSIKGSVPSQKYSNLEIALLLNNKIVAKKIFKSGIFKWNIPLTDLHNLKNNSNNFMQFKIMNNRHRKVPDIKIDRFALSGFLKEAEIFNLKRTPTCFQRGELTICDVYVPKNINLLELPVFYYPDLLNIKLNNRAIGYKGVFVYEHLAAAINPKKGTNNHIEINFLGLGWANQITYLAWGLWLMFFGYLILKPLSLYRFHFKG